MQPYFDPSRKNGRQPEKTNENGRRPQFFVVEKLE
jgi:hypothetical protein